MVKLTRSKTVSATRGSTSSPAKKTSLTAPRAGSLKKTAKAPSKEKQEKRKQTFIQIQNETLTHTNHHVQIFDKTKKKELKKSLEQKQLTQKIFIAPVRSHFKMPLLPQKYMGSVSRYAGIALVASGLFLSFFNLYAERSGYAQLHGVRSLATLTSGVTVLETVPSGTTTATVPLIQNTTTDTKPAPRIALEGASPFSGAIPIAVVVPFATEVKLILERTRDNYLTTLGDAVKLDNSTWKYVWQTTNYEDGEYRIKIIVRNAFGTYDDANGTTYAILNHAMQTITTSATTSGESTIQADKTSTSTPSISYTTTLQRGDIAFEAEDAALTDGSMRFKATVENATEIKVYARNTKTLTLFYIGLAKQKTPMEWYAEWNTTNIPNGTYSVLAKAKAGTQIIESRVVSIEIKNSVTALPETRTGTGTEPIPESDAQPHISLRFLKTTPLSKASEILIESEGMSWMELYALSRHSLTPYFLGLGKQTKPNVWSYLWETAQSPNGEYAVYARGKSKYGFVESNHQNVIVQNTVVSELTETEEKKLDAFMEAKNELVRNVDVAPGTQEASSSVEEPEKQVYMQPVKAFISEIETKDQPLHGVEKLLTDFKATLHEKLERLSRAERSGNAEEVQSVSNEIEALKKGTISGIPQDIGNKDVVLRIEGYVYQNVSILQELTISNERMLKERIGDAVTEDSDKDGISDYDEINLYKTNPFVADSDGDSFIDGVEVKGGYDPNSSDAEALMVYESPKESGVTRDDLLFVDSITALTRDDAHVSEAGQVAEPQKALISGKALPNSFVTVYIYSTPIIVTVRTDAEGNWSYIFDKELEDGNHEIYVGITDNAGRMVAKSSPLSFVKKAEAFTKVDSAAAAVEAHEIEPDLVSHNIVFLLGSVLVVMLGLILIIIGIHVTAKKVPVETLPLS